MLKKRLIGVITVRDGWAVQSFGYDRYLPLGRPEVLVENLDRWSADEILIQCIDRGAAGPDIGLLERVARAGLSTPLIYAGGIRNADDAVSAVRAGADRICVDALLHDDLEAAAALGGRLGAQAVIASLPLVASGGAAHWLDYRSGHPGALPSELLAFLRSGAVSEALLIDAVHEGNPASFDATLIDRLDLGLPTILFGGISEPEQMAALLARPTVVALGVGNFLNYREHSLQALREAIGSAADLRAAAYDRPLAIA